MAGKLIEMNEVAKMLGVTADQLSEMRQRGDIRGLRDGASWKFKQEDVERYLADRAGGAASKFDQDFDQLVPGKSPEDDSASEADSISILVTEERLGRSPETTSSTIIGKQRAGSAAADSDIKIAGEEGVGSDIELVGESGAGSDLKLTAGGSDVLSGSDAKLKKSGSATGEMKIKPSGGSDVLSGKEMVLKKTGSGTGDLELGGEELALGSDSLSLQDDENSALSLEADSDDELVLGGSGVGSGVGSDVSLDPQGSGINLGTPADSGLNLSDEPLELGGSAVESLELPEDDDVISLDDAADPDQATQLKADEEFLLSPMDEGAMDDSSDSGSQVIALEDSDAFDENAVTMLKPGQGAPTFGESPILTEDTGDVMGQQLAGLGMGTAGMTATMAGPTQHGPVSLPEAPYTVVQVLMLVLPVLSLSLAGMLMFDVLRNMWAYDSTTSASTSIMDSVLGMFNLK